MRADHLVLLFNPYVMTTRTLSWSFRGGGMNRRTGRILPFYFLMHKANWYKPWTWIRPLYKEKSAHRTVDFVYYRLGSKELQELVHITVPRYWERIDTILIEINNQNFVSRELGFTKEGELIHKAPSRVFSLGGYGIFDALPIHQYHPTGDFREISKAAFEQQWIINKG